MDSRWTGQLFSKFSGKLRDQFLRSLSAFRRHGFDYADRRYRNERLKAAQNVLSNFLLVGIAEYLDEGWRLLRHRAEQIGIQLPDVRIPTENVTADQRDSLDWIRADDEVGGKLLDSVREDLLCIAGVWISFGGQPNLWRTPLRPQNDVVKCRHRMGISVRVEDVEYDTVCLCCFSAESRYREFYTPPAARQ